MRFSEQIDILIVGGGVIGLTAAIAMRQRGFSVTLLDAGNPTNHTNKRVYALNHASQDLFRSLNIWAELDASKHSPYREMYVWDAVNGAHIHFNARELGKSELGFIFEENALKETLLQQCRINGVVLFPETQVDQWIIEPEGITLHSKKNTWHARFLLITDGANSPTRAHLQVPITTWPYHQHAIVATVQTEHPHNKTAYQVFNPDGPLAFLPLADPHHCSIVWSMSPAQAAYHMQLADDAFNNALTSAFANRLGKSQLIHPRQQFPLHMRHTTHYHDKRWILMGDAAHTIHPLAGLGLNVGLADLATWISLLEKQPDFCSTRVLGAYQRQRKHAVWQTIALMEGLKLLFANPLPPITTLRGIGLNAINRLAPVKRLLMTYATGITE